MESDVTVRPVSQGHPDEECESCRAFWEARNLPPRRLVGLPKKTDMGIQIVVCPFCDGSPIIENNGLSVT